MDIKSRSDTRRLVPLFFKTWLYFAIMAAITLLLLWLFQYVFFNYFYYDSQKDHIRDISSELLQKDYAKDPDWTAFERCAVDQNLDIYIFIFNKNELSLDRSGYSFPSNTRLSFYTPFYKKDLTDDISVLPWAKEQTSDFLARIADMGEEKEFSYLESTSTGSMSDTLFFGGQLKGDFGEGSRGYYCMVSRISKSNYSVVLMQNMLFLTSVVILAISIIFSIVFSKRLSAPINKLAVTADQLAKGDFDVNFESQSFVEVKKLAASLNFAKDEMSKTEQMRRDFFANVSHDLRTPLTMIRAYAEMIRDLSGSNEEKRTKHCQIIIDESNRLSMLVGDIQNLSKLQAGTDDYKRSDFDISELCNTVVRRFGIMSETQGYVFNTDCAPQVMCNADYSKIEQVLYNLIGNAVNYTGEDKTVTVRCMPIENGCRVEISDTGKGISPEDIPFVWDRYYRANEKKRSVVGSGLGLNIVKIILDGHKARYGVDSVVGQGTTFWFELVSDKI